MVVFVCCSCGTSLKKNQVEKHWYSKCGQNRSVSCMDCGKDFWGYEFSNHTKCITEDEKYGGSNYVAKEMKGEKKQEAWIALIQEKVAITNNMQPRLRELLRCITNYPNIPRKEKKFKNFVMNSMNIKRREDSYLVDRAWDVFQAASSNSKDNKSDNVSNGVNDKSSNSVNGKSDTNDSEHAATKSVNGTENPDDLPTSKMSKRERKEERRKKQSKKQKKDKNTDITSCTKPGTKRKLDEEDGEEGFGDEEAKPKKSKKKRKKLDISEEEKRTEELAGVVVNGKKKKKSKHDSTSNGDHEEGEDGGGGDGAEPQPSSPFKWKAAIRTVLQDAPEEGLKVSKLRRKVFSLYLAAHGEATHQKSKEELSALLNKKLQMRNDKYIVCNDRVKLRS